MQGGGGKRGGGRGGQEGVKHIGMDKILAFTSPVLFWGNKWIFKRKKKKKKKIGIITDGLALTLIVVPLVSLCSTCQREKV